MKIAFSKMHGLGNDFVVINAIDQAVVLSATQIRTISDRHFGVGCDQLLMIERPDKSSNADFKYRIFNADGSEVAQCGNGARCFARFVVEQKLTDKKEILVDTQARQMLLRLDSMNNVTVNMGVPIHEPGKIPLLMDQERQNYSVMLDGNEWQFGAVSMGNPHAVIIVNDVAQAPVEQIGSVLESHALFPERVNVGFMQFIDRSKIKLRVFERGSGETLACGSGACAAVVLGIEKGLLDSTVEVGLPGGKLIIQWAGRKHPVLMTGPAETVFEGWIEI